MDPSRLAPNLPQIPPALVGNAKTPFLSRLPSLAEAKELLSSPRTSGRTPALLPSHGLRPGI